MKRNTPSVTFSWLRSTAWQSVPSAKWVKNVSQQSSLHFAWLIVIIETCVCTHITELFYTGCVLVAQFYFSFLFPFFPFFFNLKTSLKLTEWLEIRWSSLWRDASSRRLSSLTTSKTSLSSTQLVTSISWGEWKHYKPGTDLTTITITLYIAARRTLLSYV
jgi:hypothetical protein